MVRAAHPLIVGHCINEQTGNQKAQEVPVAAKQSQALNSCTQTTAFAYFKDIARLLLLKRCTVCFVAQYYGKDIFM